MIECAILLEARDSSKNIFKSYYIAATYDLFGRLIVEVIHGRIGVKGKRTTFHVDNEGEAKYFISTFLKQHEHAVTQLGVPYRLKYKTGHWDMDEALFPFRQDVLFDDPFPMPIKKQRRTKALTTKNQGLFCYDS